jgi:hypothetical protein
VVAYDPRRAARPPATAESDPLAELPAGGESPFVRTTNRLAVGALPLTDSTIVPIDDVVERVSLYASTYVPDDAGFSRFSHEVGSSFSGGAFVSETLVSQLTVEEPWSVKAWRYDIYEDEETGAVTQGFSFSIWFEAPPQQVFASLLAEGTWTEYADYTSLPNDFAVYSATAFMQAFADGDITNAQVTVTP